MSNYTKLDQGQPDIDDDFFIQPDVETTVNSSNINNNNNNNNNKGNNGSKPAEAERATGASGTSGSFNFANFVNPQTYLDPILASNNVEVQERQFSGGNTLDESVVTTLKRDLSSISEKLLSILWPLRLRQKLKVLQHFSGLPRSSFGTDDEEHGSGLESKDYSKEAIRKILDWDLWGPLVINLGFSLIITYLQTRTLDDTSKSKTQPSSIFSGAFTLIWACLAVLSLNIQLLSPVKQQTEDGGTTSGVIGLSFFQCISILSYTLFPIVLSGLISIFVKFKLVRIVITTLMLFWSLLCSWLILAIINNCKTPAATPQFLYDAVTEPQTGSDGDKRIFLMIYPIFLVYGLFSWFNVIV